MLFGFVFVVRRSHDCQGDPFVVARLEEVL